MKENTLMVKNTDKVHFTMQVILIFDAFYYLFFKKNLLFSWRQICWIVLTK
jgi:hypothetical protein